MFIQPPPLSFPIYAWAIAQPPPLRFPTCFPSTRYHWSAHTDCHEGPCLRKVCATSAPNLAPVPHGFVMIATHVFLCTVVMNARVCV